MKHAAIPGTALMLALAVAGPAAAGDQLEQIGTITKRAQQLTELHMSDEEEQKLGAEVNERIRTRYGVVQDEAVHRYVTLVGAVLAQASDRPNLPWTFTVLDVPSVNAFAAPGGYVHITRGALALIQNEAELAGVLGHELIHITQKHTIHAIQKKSGIKMGAQETLSGNAALFDQVVGEAVANITNQAFSAGEETESDQKGVILVNKVGYAPGGLGAVLARIKERNKDTQEKRGLFPSHPEMQQRIDRLAKQVSELKPAGTATVDQRYKKFISYTPTPQSAIAMVEAGAAGLAGGGGGGASGGGEAKEAEPKKEEPKKRGFGLGRLISPGGGEKKSAEASASGGSRGLDPERDAQGGPNPKPVPVKVAAADVAAFRKEGGLL
jgi:predicted Zn-dependent protease